MENSCSIGLTRGPSNEWEQWTYNLKHSAIRLKDVEDEITWSKNKVWGRYTTKMGMR